MPILNSQAEVAAFCLELSKEMGMRYKSPPLPVNLNMTNWPPEGHHPADFFVHPFPPASAPAPVPSAQPNTNTSTSDEDEPLIRVVTNSGRGYSMEELTTKLDSFARRFEKPRDES